MSTERHPTPLPAGDVDAAVDAVQTHIDQWRASIFGTDPVAALRDWVDTAPTVDQAYLDAREQLTGLGVDADVVLPPPRETRNVAAYVALMAFPADHVRSWAAAAGYNHGDVEEIVRRVSLTPDGADELLDELDDGETEVDGVIVDVVADPVRAEQGVDTPFERPRPTPPRRR